MERRTLKTLAAFSTALLAFFVIGLSPVLASHEKGHSSYTEDNDTNDNNTPNNVSDDGDNAHPSGKDRSVESGGSGNQGKSQSHPDDSKGPMRCEGTCGEADKPNSGGGADKADQDNNNGCGNDDDFDDDNNGWCGKPGSSNSTPPAVLPDAHEQPVTPGEPDKSDMPGKPDAVEPSVDEQPATPDEVLGAIIRRANGSTPDVAVLGARVDAAPAANAATLPFTGSNLLPFVLVGLVFVMIGFLVLRGRRAS